VLGALAPAAWPSFLDAAREIADSGAFARLGGARPFAEVDGFFETE
jgi:hypothetical protein